MARKTSRSTASPSPSDDSELSHDGERLQKVLAAAGIASRRECETLIVDGRVEVDRQTVTQLGTRVDPTQQEIRVDGTPLTHQYLRYFLVNKPVGVVSTNRDPEGRERVIDLVPGGARLFTVGRLDRTSEGLILVTNDGELANRLTHPRYGIAKTYRARVAGHPSPEDLQKLRKGTHLAEGVAKVESVRVKGRRGNATELEIVLTEGRNREIRRILARLGHKVLQLRRIRMGPLRLGHLTTGAWRELSADEIRQLKRCVRHTGKSGRNRSTSQSSGPSPRAGRGSKRTRTKAGESTRHGTVLEYSPAVTKKPSAGKSTRTGKKTRTKGQGKRR